MLGQWLRTPHVARWWADDSSEDGLEAMYGGTIDGTEPAQVFVAECAGRPIGLAQRFRMDAYPSYRDEVAALAEIPARASSIDYLIGPADAIGQGLGTEMIRAFVERLWLDDPGATSIVVAVHAANRASWRALERAGFHRAADGALTPDNPADSTEHFVYRIDRQRVRAIPTR